ncbi:ribonucleotide-diphosphate reductase alpha subunit [Vibrio phage BONAISHI]|nr:ribonucleotide-diphosphate reductase alpha subunit [Vibrio phage BONAISHI]
MLRTGLANQLKITGVRKGSATTFFPIWHIEARQLMELKNNRGVEENRVRTMDYGFQINRFFYERLQRGKTIRLFCPSEVPGLYEAFFQDQAEFARLYEKYEKMPHLRHHDVAAKDLFGTLMQERAGTGRIYIQHVDHTNMYGNFIEEEAPTFMSNLCVEITLPTKPLKFDNDPEGEIALCTLAAFNLGVITLEEFPRLAELVVRFLDALLDYQDYPSEAARNSSMKRRTLGVGIINYAYWIAKNGFKYSDGSANNMTHLWIENMQYSLMKASVQLAKEKGACPAFNQTKMAKGILPIDNYKREVDELHTQELTCDWEGLRADIAKYGMRNSTMSAFMPSETSSQIANATNGIEPPNKLMTRKASKDGILSQVVPDVENLRDSYELRWNMPDNIGYIHLVGIMQKFVCQAISANTNYDPAKFPGGKVPMNVMLKELMTCYKYGVKTLYYHNTEDGSNDPVANAIEKEDESCGGGGCKI